jgi:hypothetical protein
MFVFDTHSTRAVIDIVGGNKDRHESRVYRVFQQPDDAIDVDLRRAHWVAGAQFRIDQAEGDENVSQVRGQCASQIGKASVNRIEMDETIGLLAVPGSDPRSDPR